MKTSITVLSLNLARKMADAAETEARKLGVNVGIAVVAADSSLFFTRSMDHVDGLLARNVMVRAQKALELGVGHDAAFIKSIEGNLGAIVIDGADMAINQQCMQAALHAIAG